MRTAGILLCVAPWVFGGVLAAQDSPGEGAPLDLKSYSCRAHLDLVALEDGRAEIVTVWAHGYYSGTRGVDENSAPISWTTVEKLAEQLTATCETEPAKLFIVALKEAARSAPETARLESRILTAAVLEGREPNKQ